MTNASASARRSSLSNKQPDYYTLHLGRAYLRPRYWPTWALVGLLRVCALLPLGVSRCVGVVFGALFMLANSKRRRIVRLNLQMCFPELSAHERARLSRRHFFATGKSYSDLGFLTWASTPRIERRTRLLGLEHLQGQVERGRRVILLVPHCLGVNFGGLLARHCPMFSMFKPPRNVVLNWFLNKGRMRFGCRLLTRAQGMRPVVRALAHGYAFYYMPDEDFGPGRSVFVPFFGVQTATLATLGRLAALADAAVVPVFVRLLKGGAGYEIALKPALERFPSGDPRLDAARMNEVLEQGIREMPEQYMWTFKLFRTRPGNVRSPYA